MNREQLAATADPGVFAVYASGGTWKTAAHLAHILDSLRDVAAGVLGRLLVPRVPLVCHLVWMRDVGDTTEKLFFGCFDTDIGG